MRWFKFCVTKLMWLGLANWISENSQLPTNDISSLIRARQGEPILLCHCMELFIELQVPCDCCRVEDILSLVELFLGNILLTLFRLFVAKKRVEYLKGFRILRFECKCQIYQPIYWPREWSDNGKNCIPVYPLWIFPKMVICSSKNI